MRTTIHFKKSQRRGVLKPSGLLVSFLAVTGVVISSWFYFGSGQSDSGPPPILTTVIRGPYEHIVLDQGEIESSNNVEIRCEVRNRSGGNTPSTTILDVVPEGTMVAEGDWLVTFDSTALETELAQQRIAVQTAQTLAIQADAAYETAVMAKREYLQGTYEQTRKTNENLIFVAEENLKKAELSYDSIKRSVARGLVSQLQLQGEEFRVDAARKDLELAKQTLDVLDNYTKEKMVTQLESDIRATKIQAENAQSSYQEELSKLQEIEEQISKCKVYAEKGGQVIYANVFSSRGSSEFVVEPGAPARERQLILRLPDPKKMQVTAKITESQVNLLEIGMPATVRVEAISDVTLHGEVVKVNEYAEPTSFWSSRGKEYKTIVRIVDPPPSIRAGLTAEIRILVEQRESALQIPVQALVERAGRTFCLVADGENYVTREVKFTSTNDKMVALDDSFGGLTENEQVVLDSRQHMAKFDFREFGLDSEDPADESTFAQIASGT